MTVEDGEEVPVGELAPQLWHTVVEVLHVGPPALHACQGVGEAPAGTALLRQFVQDWPVQIRAGDHLLLLPLFGLLPLSCSPAASFEERADPLLCLFHQMSHECRHFHAALPGCPHASSAQLMWWESSGSPALASVAGAEGWGGPDVGPVQCLQSPGASGLRAWLPELMDVPSALSTLPAHLLLLSSSSLKASQRSTRGCTHVSLLLGSLSSQCCWGFFTFSLAFPSLFPVPAVLTVPCYFPLNAALIGWLFVCTNPCSVCITTVISGLPRSPPSCLHLCPAHMFGNLSLRSAGIIERHGDGLQECQPFSVHCLTDWWIKKPLNHVITYGDMGRAEIHAFEPLNCIN